MIWLPKQLKMLMKKLLMFFVLFLPCSLFAQKQITLEMAVDEALKNNFDILISRNNAEISKINNNYGVAGGLPYINATAGDNASLTTSHQEYSDGSVSNINNAFGNNVNAEISMSMVLFNGMKVYATKKRLSYLQEMGTLNLNQEIQNTIAAVMMKYYDIVRQERYLSIIKSSLEISQKKFDIVSAKKDVGLANDADLLQAKIDLNLSEQDLNSQQLVVSQVKTDLMELIGVRQFEPFIITDTAITVDTEIQSDSVFSFMKANYQYLSAEQQIKVNEQLVKEVKAQRYPSLKLNAAYDFTYNQNNKGYTLLNQNFGPYAGLNLQIPIFNGNTVRIQQKTAELDLNNARLQKESLLNHMTSSALNTFSSYTNSISQLKSQQDNYELSKKLVNLVLEKFQVNQSTILDLKAAQQSFENTAYFLVNLQYQAKTAEIELKRLTCSLK